MLRHVLSPIKEESCEIIAYLRKVGAVETLQSTTLDYVEQPLLPIRCSFIPHEVTSEFSISPSENVSEQHRIVKGSEIAERHTVEAPSIAPSTRVGGLSLVSKPSAAAVEKATKVALSPFPRRCNTGSSVLTCSRVSQNAHFVPFVLRDGDHRDCPNAQLPPP